MIEQNKLQVDTTSRGSGIATRIHYRILALTFLMAFLMYMERGAIGASAPSIMAEFHINKITMGWCVSAFNWSYALFQVPGGWMADRFGSRVVLAAAIAWWSMFTAGTGLSFSAMSLAATRFLFGAGEAAAFPAGSKALARWLPVRQRAFGQGFQHSGSRLGAAIAPALVVSLIAITGWRWVFIMFGAAGVLWAGAWFFYYRNDPSEHPGCNAAEVEQLAGSARRKPARGSVPWRRILRSRDLWYLSAAYFSYGWVLWLYLAWFPTYLREARHFSALKSGLASVPLIAATITNVAGGLLSDKLAARWGDLRRGRLTVSIAGFLVAGFALLPGVMAGNAAAALAWLTLALGGLEMTVAVSWAMCLDIGGDYSGSVSSVMNTWGNLGGAISAAMIGYLATLLGWTSPFLVASFFCLLSALLVSRIDPRRSAVS
ncbi:MAG TPA: MFS transporter [Bryobacteraceae bacterium]|nr:MFS transporter [Bryobacteraceae bacterium]